MAAFSILTPLQRDFLRAFFARPVSQAFFLTGERLAREKDLGFSEFYFAGMLRESRRITTLPRMIEPLTVEELRAFFETIARRVILRLKPPE